MRALVVVVVAAVLTVLTPPAASAVDARCAELAQLRAAVERRCPCDATAKKPHARCVATALRGSSVSAGCRRATKAVLRGSICGRPKAAAICCRVSGRAGGMVAPRPQRCRAGTVACPSSRTAIGDVWFSSVHDVCTAGGCRPIPTTTTTSTTPYTTTTRPCAVGGPCDLASPSLELTTTVPLAASCGHTADGSGATLGALGCGALTLGGGAATLPDVPLPSGIVQRFIAECAGDVCSLSPTLVQSGCWRCTAAGCVFGPPIPIEHGALSLCVLPTLARDASGTLDRVTGAVSGLTFAVDAQLFLRGATRYKDGGGPCPTCAVAVGGASVHGTPFAPATGVCDGGRDAGKPCTSTNPDGLSIDCRPGGTAPGAACDPAADPTCADGTARLGDVMIDFSPVGTASLTRTASAGAFCSEQRTPGCFARGNDVAGAACRTVTTDGVPAGRLTTEAPRPIVLTGFGCVGPTGIPLFDTMADLPGPASLRLFATAQLLPATLCQ